MTTREERALNIAEELKLCMGFEIIVELEKHTWVLKLDTIAGAYKYTPSEKTLMGDVYRFISNLGLKLHKWGLNSKISENKESGE